MSFPVKDPSEKPPTEGVVPSPGELLQAQKRAGRSAFAGLMLLWAGALVSPLWAYREDVRSADEELLAHLSDRAELQAQAFGAHVQLLRAELSRLAVHPALRPEDGTSGPEEVALLDSAFSQSPLFRGGAALLSREGKRVWSDPPAMRLGSSGLTERRWFRRAVDARVTSVDLLDKEGEGLLVVAHPVVHGDDVVGLLVGELVTATQQFPGAPEAGERRTVILLDEEGKRLLPNRLPPHLSSLDLSTRLRSLERGAGAFEAGERELFAAVTAVPGTGLTLAVVEDESEDRERLQARYARQLLFHTALLGGMLLVFTVLLRRSYRSLLAADERLRRQETMAALGEASSLIAHEVKNALNGIKAALSMMRGQSETQNVPLAAMRSQVERLGHLARSLLTFASPRTAHRRLCDLKLLAEEALGAVKMVPEAAEVAVETGLEEGVVVEGDPALLVSAIDNLLRNAVEAGAVARDTGEQPNPWVSVTLKREGDEAVLEVIDNAGGVPLAFEPRLWEPFAVGRAKGIGLGLPMVRTSVGAHGGSVVYTRIPGGSRFTVRLPLPPQTSQIPQTSQVPKEKTP